MILPDTSVWIEFLKGREPYAFLMKMLMEDQNVFAAEEVFAELHQGVKNKREFEIIQKYWSALPKPGREEVLVEAGIESKKNKWLSSGIGLIDASLIVQARREGAKIWSLDKKLTSLLRKKELYQSL